MALEAALLSVALARPYGHHEPSGAITGLEAYPTGSKHNKSASGYAHHSGSPTFDASGLMMGVHPTGSSHKNLTHLEARWGHGKYSQSTSTSTYTTTITSTTTVIPTASASIVSEVQSVSSEQATSSTEVSSSAISTTAASSSAASTPTSASTTGKRGLSYNVASLCNGFDGSSQISWAYNWASSSSGLTGFEYVPMLWGLSSTYTSSWASAVSSALSSGSSHLLSFNEPDLAAQSNISPSDAAAGYITYMQPHASSAKLGSPAVTNGGSPMGLTWLGEFLSDCSTCTIDFVPIHWYSSASDVDYFKSYVTEAYAAGGNRPLWITEFAASGTADEQNTFLEAVMPWLDSTPMVERYAYFMTAAGTLVNSDGSLTTLGQTWNS